MYKSLYLKCFSQSLALRFDWEASSIFPVLFHLMRMLEKNTCDSGLCRLHICKHQPLLSFRFRPFHILSEKVWLWFLNFVGKRKHLHIFGKLIKITPYPYTYPHFSYLKSTIQNDGRCTPFHTCTLALQVQSHVVQVSQTFGPIVSMKSYLPNQVWKVWVCPHK